MHSSGPRKASERESRGGESTFIREDGIAFQAALQEIRLRRVVIPPGSPQYPASFTTPPRLSSSMLRLTIDHFHKTPRRLRLIPSLHPRPPKNEKKKNIRNTVKLGLDQISTTRLTTYNMYEVVTSQDFYSLSFFLFLYWQVLTDWGSMLLW